MTGRLRVPAEWEPHECAWLAFPHAADEWPHNLTAAQRSIAALSQAIAGPGGEPVRLFVVDDAHEEIARRSVGDARGVDYVHARYGDCWTRDTLPLMGHTKAGRLGALAFLFNGWGGKFMMPGDETIGAEVIGRTGATPMPVEMVLEGGALEFDGAGTCLTTKSCVLNPNRNPGLSASQAADMLTAVADITRLIWLSRGLRHDHTDGHVDMIARFVAPDTVLSTESSVDDPNADIHRLIMRELEEAGLTVLPLPSPGLVVAPDGSALPANYCNFYIANQAVVFPCYGVPQDQIARARIEDVFPGRQAVGLPANDLLWGGGAFHCATQPQPMSP